MFSATKNNSRFEIQKLSASDTRTVINMGLKNQITIDTKLCRFSFNDYLILTNRIIELCSNFFISYSELITTLEMSIKSDMDRYKKTNVYNNRIWNTIVNNFYNRSIRSSIFSVNIKLIGFNNNYYTLS